MADKRVHLNLNIPGVTADGNAVSIRDDGNVSLIFFQINPQEDPNADEIPANAIAHIRMTLDQMKALDEAIQKTITQHEQKLKAAKVNG